MDYAEYCPPGGLILEKFRTAFPRFVPDLLIFHHFYCMESSYLLKSTFTFLQSRYAIKCTKVHFCWGSAAARNPDGNLERLRRRTGFAVESCGQPVHDLIAWLS